MNFLLRTTQNVAAEPPPVREPSANLPPAPTAPKSATLEGLIAEDPFPQFPATEDHDGVNSDFEAESGGVACIKDIAAAMESHTNVSDEEGWVTIPYKDLPEDWNHAPDIESFLSLDRSFVFPGEQVHILACLSACKQETEIITPFKVAAVMSKNGMGKGTQTQNGNISEESNSVPEEGDASPSSTEVDQNGKTSEKAENDLQKDISASESLLRMEDQRRQTETLLQRFKDSHFFVRIAESGEPLWSKKSTPETLPTTTETDGQQSTASESEKVTKNSSCLNAVIDRGNFDANVSGGVARDSVKCCSLPNGDLVVLLQVNVGVDSLKDPIIEILQFEKYQDKMSSDNQNNLNNVNQDPCGELLKWLLPLENSAPPLPRPLTPPLLSSGSGISSTSHRYASSASSGTQLFSFGHFRSYSMSSLPQNSQPPSVPVKAQSSKPSFNIEEWDQYSSQKNLTSRMNSIEGPLSFRGVSLERERFAVHCGLEGIHIPGRRWRKKIEIVHPIEIHSYAADCNTDDLLCVQLKNVSPVHIPDLVVYVDAITVVFDEASKGGPPASLPVTCIEAGNDHSLPNLALRRGEEHSFILKPASSLRKDLKNIGERNSKRPALRLPSKTPEKGSALAADHFAILVSCRCNYTASRLFFKHPISWRPRIFRDLMISVASEMLGQSSCPSEKGNELPVQVLTLQASNLTSEDLTMTVLAPASFTSPPSVVSLSSSPASPMSPFIGFSEFAGRANSERRGAAVQNSSSVLAVQDNPKQNENGGVGPISINKQSSPSSDVIPSAGFSCSHLWLQSRVPLGCVPSHSTATVKLELLPLTDGIITLDTLQIDVKEKGLTYIPEHSLRINATSSVSTGIM